MISYKIRTLRYQLQDINTVLYKICYYHQPQGLLPMPVPFALEFPLANPFLLLSILSL